MNETPRRIARLIRQRQDHLQRSWEEAARDSAPAGDRRLRLSAHLPALLERLAGSLEETAQGNGHGPRPSALPGSAAEALRLASRAELAAALRELTVLRRVLRESLAEDEPPDGPTALLLSELLDQETLALTGADADEAPDPHRTDLDPGRLLGALIHQMPVGISVARAPDAAVIIHNEEAERIVGHAILSERGYEDYARYGAIHPDGSAYAPDDYPMVRSLFRGEEVRDEEMRYVRGDGRETWLCLNAGPIRDAAGRIVAAVTTFYDISARKEAEAERRHAQHEIERLLEEQREAVRTRDMLLAVVSHDLRNPLGAIRLAVTALRAYEGVQAVPRAERRLQTIERSTQRMDRMIADLLDVAAIQAANLELTRNVQPVETVVEEAADLEEPLAAEKGVLLVKDLQLEGARALIDRDRILQALGNVVSNAVRFSAPGDQVTVRGRRAADQAELAVVDTGTGIPEDELPHVFEPYWSSARGAKKGTGLGLHITRAIVEGHGGRIWIESALGEGTTVRLTLPLAATDADG